MNHRNKQGLGGAAHLGLRARQFAVLGMLALLLISSLLLAGSGSGAFAQSQAVTATPGYINLGMNTTVTFTSSAAGTYSVVVKKPSGTTLMLTMAFAGAGAQSAVFGNATVGFNSTVDQVGTYNVFVEQGATVLYSTSFYATNKMVIKMDMVNGGLCYYIQDAPRGSEIFPRFFVTYLSDGSTVTNLQLSNVSYQLPGGSFTNATWHKPGVEGVGFFIGKILPNWNYTYIGPYYPNATATDMYGNVVNYTYMGRPFQILPAQLISSVQLIDANSSSQVTSLYTGERITINASISYSDTNISGVGAVTGYVAPLDPSRGGTVTALVGWGNYNSTSRAFGGAQPGGLLGTIQLTYSNDSSSWMGQFDASSLPNGTSAYEVVVLSSDSASPSNTGSQIVTLAPANAPVTPTPVNTLTFSEALITAVATLIVGLAAGIISSPIRRVVGNKP